MVFKTKLDVITGPVPVISIGEAQLFSVRDGRDKPGHDEESVCHTIPDRRCALSGMTAWG
ncbi:hypothetical protein DC522_00965 [Microvirga sp. KLBC 81]|uniref:hypothetical protein n=1 Tax=Microvirga sp. KLBC 81 TaxID=1862707 RepID=UPI000D521742|nr:hypothetical protein [Microvirga sp. KLBC 81]PVE26361.1 hypothetical protein DC522_00965 [Microvirga sp. KLBC 81]